MRAGAPFPPGRRSVAYPPGVAPTRSEARIRLGVSSCLLGEKVRYDGGHKHDRYLTGVLGRYVEWVPVCPELESGMGVPRPSVRLERRGGELQMIDPKSGSDFSATIERTARRRVALLRELDLCGYVLKRGSPSCGMERVKVYGERGMPRREGRGLFATALLEALPCLPVEEEGRLSDPRLRENFIERIFAYRRLRDLFAARFARRRVVDFHTAHKLQVMAHSPEAYRRLGRLVGGIEQLSAAGFRDRYEQGFMGALAHLATPGRNTNVLQHMAGFLREGLPRDDRKEVADLIDDYRAGLVPLIVPLTLLRHHARRLRVEYLLGQTYLEPHPRELMLRNHV
jgi:uncharacterized protein YbgA (DUF1722 family)/uncharacterized protein YbbK (DUF523 family)